MCAYVCRRKSMHKPEFFKVSMNEMSRGRLEKEIDFAKKIFSLHTAGLFEQLCLVRGKQIWEEGKNKEERKKKKDLFSFLGGCIGSRRHTHTKREEKGSFFGRNFTWTYTGVNVHTKA